MKKTAMRKDILREFKKSFSRFLSITLIVCLGVGFFTGIKATAPSMIATAQDYFAAYNLMDIKLLSTAGFGDDDVEAIKVVDGIKNIMPSYSTDVMAKIGGEEDYNPAKLMSLVGDGAKQINQAKLIAGRMPAASGECVISKQSVKSHEYKIGDKITIGEKAGTTDVKTVLKNLEYEVVGLIDSPLYFTYSYGMTSLGNGAINSYIMIPASEFTYSRYTEVYLTLDIDYSNVKIFTDEYYDIVDKASGQLSKIGVVQLAKFIEESKKQLAKSEEELEQSRKEAYQQLESSMTQLKDAKKKLDNALKDIKNGWSDYNTQYASFEEQITVAEKKIKEAQDLVNEQKKTLAAAEKKYNNAKSQLAASRKKLDEGWAEYNKSLAEYNEGLEKVQAAKDEIAPQKEKLDSARKDLDDGWKKYNSSLATYNRSVKSLESSKKQYEKDLASYNERLDAYNSSTEKDELEAIALAATKAILNTQKATIASTEKKLQESKKQLDESKIKLEDGEAEYEAGLAKYNEGYAKIAAAEEKLNKSLPALQDAKKKLDEGEKEYKEGEKELDDAYDEITKGKKEIANAEKQIKQSQNELNKKKKEANSEFAKNKDKLNDAENEYQTGMNEYEDGITKYDESKVEVEQKLSDGAAQIQSAGLFLTEIEDDKWYVYSRNDAVTGYSGLNDDTSRIDALAGIFPVFFLIVAALVCLTTMSRMVEEQRTQMGTYKALGYSRRQILFKYMIYAFSASIIGGIIGQICCVQIFPRAISGAYSSLYRLPEMRIVFPWAMAAVSLLVGLACTALVTYICCRKEIRSVTAALIRPKAPKVGRQILLERIPKIWNLFNFSYKITIRNLFRYKVRFFMTVIGITGCMALIVSGFGLQNSISPIVDLQFGHISSYDYLVSMYEQYDNDTAAKCRTELLKDDAIGNIVFTRQIDGTVTSKSVSEEMNYVYLLVPQNVDDYQKMVRLEDADTGETVKMQDGSAVITEKMAKQLNVGVGNSITFHRGTDKYTVKVSGITKNYVYHYIYITPATFEKLFGTDITYNSFIGTAAHGSVDSEKLLAKNSNFLTVMQVDSLGKSMEDTLSSMYLVVAILIISAGCLAIVVLYNLTNISISDRVREIATTKVLGFTHKEANMYVFRENIIMTVIGLIFGNIFGYLLAQLMINMVEVDMVMFSRTILPSSYIYSSLITIFITILVDLMMSRKIKNISMVESLKSIE